MLILHVDDDEGIRALTELAFSLGGHGTVRSAASGAEAISALESGFRPDVILLDVMMPVLDGPGVLTRIRRLEGHDETPVIFMTAQTQDHELNRLVALGGIGVIIKPFDPLTLPDRVKGLLGSGCP
ncbi:MAG: response regulator [Brevundimonas sp.]|uniref:response regulator n=1 Tax=Brevundimonas sp. TaxID=1871086 RepID=UPI0024879DD0|nr:response regulator [Brevundimonas sp.]MDI1326174.1 response regulator [Brevundimonas sp.]